MNNAVACAPLHTGYTVYAKLVAVSCLWGGTFVAGRYLSADVAPLLSASVRFVLASLTLLLVLSLKGQLVRQVTASQALQLVLLGFFGVFAYNVFSFMGCTTSAHPARL